MKKLPLMVAQIVLVATACLVGLLVAIPPARESRGGPGEELFARLILWIPTLVVGFYAARSLRRQADGQSGGRFSWFSARRLLPVGAVLLAWDVLCLALWYWNIARWPTNPLLLMIAFFLLAAANAPASTVQSPPNGE